MASDKHFGGAGPDLLYGDGSGEDPDGSNPDDQMYGGSGNDTLIGDYSWPYGGGGGSDLLDGGNGDDVLEGRAGDDTLLGAAGDDSLKGEYGEDTLDGRAGDDWMAGREGADVLDGGAGNNTVSYSDGDYLYDSSEPVTVDLATGIGRGGHAEGDRLFSIQNIVGTAGNDALTGDDGDNRIDGRILWDYSYGWLYPYETNPIEWFTSDTLAGAGGDDTLIGSGTLDGGAGDDALIGGGSPDNALTGGPGHDVLSGNGALDGGTGDDRLIGYYAPPNSYWYSSNGWHLNTNTLTGGNGADEFVIGNSRDGIVTVTDFDATEGDRLSVALLPEVAGLLTWQSGGDVRVLVETSGPFGLSQVAVLKDTTVAALGAEWWHMG